MGEGLAMTLPSASLMHGDSELPSKPSTTPCGVQRIVPPAAPCGTAEDEDSDGVRVFKMGRTRTRPPFHVAKLALTVWRMQWQLHGRVHEVGNHAAD